MYNYPINAVLFQQAGGNHSAEEIRTMVNEWIVADRWRFVAGVVAFLGVLRAFQLPLSDSARTTD